MLLILLVYEYMSSSQSVFEIFAAKLSALNHFIMDNNLAFTFLVFSV